MAMCSWYYSGTCNSVILFVYFFQCVNILEDTNLVRFSRDEDVAVLDPNRSLGVAGQKGKLAEVRVTGRVGDPLQSVSHKRYLCRKRRGEGCKMERRDETLHKM